MCKVWVLNRSFAYFFHIVFALFIMVNCCVIIGCSNHYKADSDISFLRFHQSKPALLQKWTQALKWKNGKPYKHKFMCSAYFELSCFYGKAGRIGHKVGDDVVSSIFPNFPKHNQNQKAERKPLKVGELALFQSQEARTVVNEHCYACNEEKA